MTGLAQDAVLPSTVGLAAAGDEVAFARIAGAYHDDMLRVAFVIANDWDLAEDAVQAALWKAWRKLPSLRDPERIRPWLVSVAANEARQIIRHRHRGGVVEIEVAPETASQPDPSADIGRLDLANALRHLKPEERALLALRYVADLDSAEIGAQSGMSASGVRSRLSRLLEQLRRELDDD